MGKVIYTMQAMYGLYGGNHKVQIWSIWGLGVTGYLLGIFKKSAGELVGVSGIMGHICATYE